jgi:hypothetical protein
MSGQAESTVGNDVRRDIGFSGKWYSWESIRVRESLASPSRYSMCLVVEKSPSE